MQKLGEKRCWIGEGPVWNPFDERLYFVNPAQNEVCCMDINGGRFHAFLMTEPVASLAFDTEGSMLVATPNGVFRFDGRGGLTDLYDPQRCRIRYANDGKVGPDGCFYVGTQSARRMGVSDAVDGKLYRIAPDGTVRVLLDGLILSNGMDWSVDGKRFYHTDSDTNCIREYAVDHDTIRFTGRDIIVQGVDGFCMDSADVLWAACWGEGHIARVDTRTMTLIDYLKTPCRIPTSCCFGGVDLRELLITSAFYDAPQEIDNGPVYRFSASVAGKPGYLFGKQPSVRR